MQEEEQSVSSSSNFVPKCGATSRRNFDFGRVLPEVETAAKVQHHAYHPGLMKCRCNDPSCNYSKYFRSQKRLLLEEESNNSNSNLPNLNNLNIETDTEVPIVTLSQYTPPISVSSRRNRTSSSSNNDDLIVSASAPSSSTYQSSSSSSSITSSSSSSFNNSSSLFDHLERCRADLISIIGGESVYQSIYGNCLRLSEKQEAVFSTVASNEGDTILMQLCYTELKKNESKSLLYGQILAFINLYLEYRTDLLFVRNQQGFNAMELAALGNKAEVATYLAYVYRHREKDVNETGVHGHTILHRLARKGDECEEALERLLDLRLDGRRLFRIDVVNSGHKTPLDVAMACKDMFATGATRTIYVRTIKLFHKVIEEDTRELLSSSSSSAAISSSSLIRNQF